MKVFRFRRCAAPLIAALTILGAACSGSSTADRDAGTVEIGERLAADGPTLQTAAAEAMGSVTSVRFNLARTEAPVYIDGAGSISLESLDGRFAAPASADALLAVKVNDSLGTKIGAVAIDEEIWLSNPVTGKFETLPAGFDIDPSSFFDPKGGWQPLLEGLQDVTLIGEETRDGQPRYHLTGVAPAADMRSITAGLVGNDDVTLDMWIHVDTALVSSLEFDTEFDGAVSSWVLELSEYGESFTITDPTIDQ